MRDQRQDGNTQNASVAWARPSGMPCPQCNTPIVVRPAALFSANAIVCTSCGLELRLNVAESAETLAVLRSYLDRIEYLQAGLEEPGAGGTASGRNRRIRRPVGRRVRRKRE